MAFSLNFTSCLKNCCEYISITDTTNVWPTVSTGWEQVNINNTLISGATITAATITVNKIDVNNNILTTVVDEKNVLPNYTGAVTGNITFMDIAPDAGGAFTDGIYNIIFTITDVDSLVYVTDIKQYFYCQAKCCVEKMIADIPNQMCDNCKYDEYLERVNKATVLLDALKSAAGSLYLTTADNILTVLQDICEFNNCNCN